MAERVRRIFMTGASGLIGSELCRRRVAAGDEVVALSRRAQPPRPGGPHWLQGDVLQPGEWLAEAARSDVVVHLGGESIAAGRWTAGRKRKLWESRVDSARRLVEAFGAAPRRPELLISASACGIYGARGDELLDESSEPGDDFLARLCIAWEQAARAAVRPETRVVCLRFGVVLSAGEGALARMLLPFRLGLGGPLGPAERWFPWIHIADAVGLLELALDPPPAAEAASVLQGPVNAVAPGAVRMGEFARCLGRVLHRPARLPVPLPLLRLALGELASGLVPGQHVQPQAAAAAGYRFVQPQLEPALRDLLARTPG
jgi:uncharacterized protein (TIGR01777 family)